MAAIRVGGIRARTLADLASVWERRGDRQRAIDVLREIWDGAPLTDVEQHGPFGHEWMPSALRLAELYRRAGRRAEAEPIEAALRQLLSTADPDFPLLLQLQRLQAAWSSAGTPAR
jgi:hypothetical protein